MHGLVNGDLKISVWNYLYLEDTSRISGSSKRRDDTTLQREGVMWEFSQRIPTTVVQFTLYIRFRTVYIRVPTQCLNQPW